jgi:poly(3-hydroxybutyrate) depolymerase
MNPDRHANSHWDYFLDLVRGDDDSAEAHRQFYDEYNAVLDMDANYYLETIRTVFQDFSLVYGTWVVNGEPVRPQDIRTTALLTVEGELDDISGAGQTEAAHGLCSGIPAERREHYIVKGAGHYGIFSGRRWREMAYPEVRKFILEHQAPMKAPAVQAEVAPAVSAEAPVAAAEPVEVVEAVSTVDADAAAVTQTTEPVDAPETSTEASVEEAPAAAAPAAPRRGKSRR